VPTLPPRFPLVLVDVGPEEADVASAHLFDLGASGVEERDATTLAKGAPGKITLVASFESDADADRAFAELHAAWSPRRDEIVGDAWRDDWKKHFRPFEIVPGFVIRPPWEPYEGGARHVAVLEPGRAFGTGLHETTALVARVLAGHRLAALEVLDVGCGSGILSVVALMLGAASARAVDVDPEALNVTRENATANGLADRLMVDDTPVERIEGRFPLVIANIEARILVPMAPVLVSRLAPGGTLVLSGILAPESVPGQVDEVRRAYARLTFDRVEQKGEWVALVFHAPEAGA
jgi:ribosomal protein L11 methyltransferase